MSDPIGDAARDPVGDPAAAGAGAGATSGAFDASAASTAVVVGPVGLSAGSLAASVVCPLLELARDGGSAKPPVDPAVGGASGEGTPGDPEVVTGPDPGNRCAASSPPAPISISQQRFVCFDAGHVDCPRFVRAMASSRSGGVRVGRAGPVQIETAAAAAAVAGAASIAAGAGSTTATSRPGGGTGGPQESPSLATPQAGRSAEAPTVAGAKASADTASPGTVLGTSVGVAPVASDAGSLATAVTPVTPVTRSSRRSGARPAGRPTPTIVAAVILVVALGLTVAFVSLRGGLALPGASSSPVAAASPSPSATVLESPSASPAVTPSPSPSPSPSPRPTLSPSAITSPTPAPTAAPSLPAAYQGLKPCTDRPDCYLYRVRSGDNLSAIAGRFGITLAALKAANPEITDPSLLHVGDVIRVPLPKN